MSKYAYTTVYEEFTGLKPPEPKSSTTKVRRKRGYGHPYRMRFNMHDDASESYAGNTNAYETINNDKGIMQALYDNPSYEKTSKQSKLALSTKPEHSVYNGVSQSKQPSPKIIYKKRRHYTMV